MNIEQRLRNDLADRAQEIDAAPDLLGSVLEGHRRQNRRRAGLLAAAVAAVVAAVAIPLGTGAGGGGAGGGAERTAELAAFTPYPQPPRGDLTAVEDYVDGLLARDWYPSPDLEDPPVETRQVLFAGTVPGGVRALVSAWEDGRRSGLWLYGAPGAGPDELEAMADAAPLPADEPVSFLSIVDGRGALVVLAEPGDLIEVSAGAEVAADGSTVQAPFEPVDATGGLAVVDAALLSPRSLTVRITRNGTVVSEGPAASVLLGGRADFDPSTALDGAAGDPDPVLVRLLVAGVLEELDLSPDQVGVDVLWGGTIGNRNRPEVVAAVLTVRLASGAVVAVGGYSDVRPANGGDELTSFAPCLRQVLPAGAATPSIAMRCDLFDRVGAGLGSQLVVVPPAGTVDVRLVGASGKVLDTRPVDGPAWWGPSPDGLAAVAALGADGTVLAEIPLGTVEPLRD